MKDIPLTRGRTAIVDDEDFDETCLTCGMLFAFSARVEQDFRKKHVSFVCPRGHSQYYPGETEEEKLRKRLTEEQAKLANAQFEQMLTEKKVKKLERRAKNGVCPCCHRQFVSVARHMKTKHPDYAAPTPQKG